jgi:hypothetical protein
MREGELREAHRLFTEMCATARAEWVAKELAASGSYFPNFQRAAGH